MKKFIASASVLAAGTAGLQAQYSAYLAPGEAGKLLTVSMALRGFYDDNYLTYPSSGLPTFRPAVTNIVGTNIVVTPATNVLVKPRESFGFELNPSLKLNLARDQTFFQANYNYWMRYYFDRDSDPVDHTHEFTGLIDHRFTERYKVILNESFVYAQEPEIVEGANRAQATHIRTESSVFRNRARLDFNAILTEIIGAGFVYENSLYNYQDENLSGILDRLEHTFDFSGRWVMDERTTPSIGYQLGLANYTSENVISFGDDLVSPSADDVKGSDRSSVTHSLYLGLNKRFSERLTVSARGGADYTIYDYSESDSTLSPAIDIWGTYEYQPGSRLTAGLRHDRSATDQVGQGSDITTDQEATIAYLTLSHKITPKLTGGVGATYQHGVFSGGVNDGDVDAYFNANLSFDYRMNENWSAQMNYYWDRLDSDAEFRSYTRNRIYFGVRATY